MFLLKGGVVTFVEFSLQGACQLRDRRSCCLSVQTSHPECWRCCSKPASKSAAVLRGRGLAQISLRNPSASLHKSRARIVQARKVRSSRIQSAKMYDNVGLVQRASGVSQRLIVGQRVFEAEYWRFWAA